MYIWKNIQNSMTLQELFTQLAEHPAYIIFYFCIIPIAAFLAGLLDQGQGHLSPWKYVYSTLIYFICVPGIFSITLSVYQFLFERRSILQADVFIQVLPVISMIVTLLIVRKNVDLDYIPGFDKLSGLVTMISGALIIMWVIDRTRIWAITYVPFQYVILMFVVLLVVIRYGWKRAFGNG